jgi:predicted acetyltransferase
MNAIEIRRATREDRSALQRVLELYQHDLSDIWDQDVDADGLYGYDLDRYWRIERCVPFVATVGGRYAGFALVDGAVKVVAAEAGLAGRWMDQFFILKKYRRQGLGRQLARAVFDALPGRWEVGQMLGNLPAQQFWRALIADYTHGQFTEHELRGGRWEGFVQVFEAKPAPR